MMCTFYDDDPAKKSQLFALHTRMTQSLGKKEAETHQLTEKKMDFHFIQFQTSSSIPSSQPKKGKENYVRKNTSQCITTV